MSVFPNQTTIDLIKRFEGLRTKAYKCPAGVWTIGYGHTGPDVHEGLEIDGKRACELLEHDLRMAMVAVDHLVKIPLTDNQRGALSAFVMNVGASAFMGSTLLKKLNANILDEVPDEMRKWSKATNPRTGEKSVLPGLMRRRQAEIELWSKP